MGVSAGLLVIAAVGTKMQMDKADEAAEKQKEAQHIREGQEGAADAASTRQQIRKERVRRAQILAGASNSGVSGSSSEATTIGGLQSTVASNLAFQNSQAGFAKAGSKVMGDIADIQASSAKIGAITSLASSAFGAAGSYKAGIPTQAKPQTTQTAFSIAGPTQSSMDSAFTNAWNK